MELSQRLEVAQPLSTGRAIVLGLLLAAALLAVVLGGCRISKPRALSTTKAAPKDSPASSAPSCPDGQLYSADLNRCATPE